MKQLFATALLVSVATVTSAQERVLRQTALPLDVRYELVTWTSYDTLRLDKFTGAVEILAGGPQANGTVQLESWETTEIKRTTLEGPSLRPLYILEPGTSRARFQMLSFAGSRPFLFDSDTGRTWVGERTTRVRADGFSYTSVQWRPVVDEKGPGDRY